MALLEKLYRIEVNNEDTVTTAKTYLTHYEICRPSTASSFKQLSNIFNNSPAKLTSFCAFVKTFDKKYTLPELIQRARIFQKNSLIVTNLNSIDPTATYSLSKSPFADLTQKEFSEKLLMKTNSHSTPKLPNSLFSTTPNSPLNKNKYNFPRSNVSYNVDWQRNGKVTSVKNQGNLGTCWAFSAMAVLESQLAIKENKLVDLSVEHLVECSNDFNDSSFEADCSEFGGWPYLGFEYLEKYGGAYAEKSFPYCSGSLNQYEEPECFPCMPKDYSKQGCGDHSDLYCNVSSTLGQKKGGFCSKVDEEEIVVKVKSFEELSDDEIELEDVLVKRGPVSVALNALFLQFYWKGIINVPFCSDGLNHAVLLVGSGESEVEIFNHVKKTEFWKVKNSWGEKWGEDGYFRIKRNSGMCGINLKPSIAKIV
eukprot:snap_masked-scaffold_42-processed-gene-2.37-mRNA-1 protein AED:0.07 eAED:0.07 QI:0/0/0/0.5/1/1/2/0/422